MTHPRIPDPDILEAVVSDLSDLTHRLRCLVSSDRIVKVLAANDVDHDEEDEEIAALHRRISRHLNVLSDNGIVVKGLGDLVGAERL